MTTKNKDYEIYAFSTSSDIPQVMEQFNTSYNGLSIENIEKSRLQYGSNTISHDKEDSLVKKIITSYITPFTSILITLAIISFMTDYVLAPTGDKDLAAVLIISTMVIVSGSMTLFQSIRSTNAAEKLTKMVRVTTNITRQGLRDQEIPIEEIVCGDIINLAAGDMIPADIRLFEAKDLFISQSTMTGESQPIEKMVAINKDTGLEMTDFLNMVYMGSNVVSGSAKGIVVRVGNNTLFGGIAKDITKKRGVTSFEMGISSVSWLLIRFMFVMAPTVLLINGLTKGDWIEASLFGLSVAVGLTPEMLPMIVTTNLVKGATGMAKRGTIIKNLNSIQNFGAIDVLCTDKTGTLTQDKIVLAYHLSIDGKEDDRVLKHAYLNSFYQTGLRNVMDNAIVDAANKELALTSDAFEKIDEVPFDFERRRMSVVIRDHNNKTQMITKGAIEEMLEVSSHVDVRGEIVPLTEGLRKEIFSRVDDLNSDGLRVLGVSQKTNPSVIGEFAVDDECDMVLIGYLAFLDPPKETTRPALQALKKHGIGVKVLTGDNALVTRTICNQVGLENEKMLTGPAIAAMSDDVLTIKLKTINIFVKLSPQQKTRIVRLLRESGKVVGFMGDGINDASAMKESDVGISVDTAVDIAKESADVILLEKDLMVLERGIIAGRKTFGNIMKYIKMTASSNFGNMFSVVVASIFLPFLPMLPIQILFLNLIYDISCVSLPWDNIDQEYVEKPKKWSASSVGSFMRWIGPTSSVFDITTYILLFFVICPAALGGSYAELSIEQQTVFIALFHAGWFVESLWSQTLVIHALRTPKIPFLQSRASFIVTTITALGIAIGTILPSTELGHALGMTALPLQFFAWLALTIASYLVLATVMKKVYIRRFGELI
ncbi:magnesium-translocating P-type ATPase [Kurthia sibirica]|uniref:Magnesium-transporting ATPase, P-type 1 n=2 Tax=Kurthia sibirica TaxID=202750 RepID=A0A2U3AQ94_9BACL|nr:magnesium-translocating P-type ATPase [Kurthia sibirica]